ncbi:MAG: DUF2335 domain-containing protein [Chloroflexi bacterium]|nr:DUF2335 domain-containing protein [Chloroflexota bacterium]MCY3582216.1 DUF2335 domain-containing protein [Chloroflexota bacterium]MCY3715044.1 DUF2335 domain-containing protein [Chloroflexota bacterium]MDE2650570.1 DUF2335 domain-containing protein [Chloroflexota bacterium]MXX50933.1 DUF2335 domain-containing protein [Chloroflexota bacterium]
MSAESDRQDQSTGEADFVSKSPILASLIQQVERYSRLIPHPSIVERYEQTLPGSADCILSMAEQRQAADISIERQLQKDSASAEISTIQGLIWNVRLGMLLVVGLASASHT